MISRPVRESQTGRWRRRLFVLATPVLALAALALAGELLLRLAGAAPLEYVPADVMQSRWWRERLGPGESLRYSGWIPMQVKDFDVLVTMNSKGWRDAEYDWTAPPGTWRLLVLGDSYVEGREVELEATFHKRLQHRLRRHAGHLPGRRVEVVALGRGGTGTADQYRLYAEVGARFSPDVVLHVLYPANDVGDNSPELSAAYNRWLSEVYVPHVAATKAAIRRRGLLIEGSWLNHWLVDRAIAFYEVRPALFHAGLDREALTPAGADIYRSGPYDATWRRAWEATRRWIVRTRELVRSSGAEYVLVLAHSAQVPGFTPEQFERRAGELDRDRPRRLVRELCEAEDIPLVELQPALEAHVARTGEPYFWTHDAHWNETGHRIVAAELERWLMARHGRPAGRPAPPAGDPATTPPAPPAPRR